MITDFTPPTPTVEADAGTQHHRAPHQRRRIQRRSRKESSLELCCQLHGRRHLLVRAQLHVSVNHSAALHHQVDRQPVLDCPAGHDCPGQLVFAPNSLSPPPPNASPSRKCWSSTWASLPNAFPSGCCRFWRWWLVGICCPLPSFFFSGLCQSRHWRRRRCAGLDGHAGAHHSCEPACQLLWHHQFYRHWNWNGRRPTQRLAADRLPFSHELLLCLPAGGYFHYCQLGLYRPHPGTGARNPPAKRRGGSHAVGMGQSTGDSQR